MPRDVVHDAKRSWLSGKVRTLCGLVLADWDRAWLASVTCPGCKAAKKAGRRL